MPFIREENGYNAHHHQGKYANLKHDASERVKNHHSHVGKQTGGFVDQKEDNESVEQHANPGKQIGREFPSK